MRRLIPIVCVLALVAACGGETAETTTTQATTTTAPPSTTTTTPPATTTTVADTTTTQATTTTTEPSGNWANEPLIVSRYGAVGWWDGASWVQVDEFTALPVSGGEDYKVVLFGSDQWVTGGAETTLCEPLYNPGVELSDPDALGEEWPGVSGLAISAPWELTPHFVALEDDDDGTYAAFARPLLASRGIDLSSPVIKQVVRFDLEGDGVNEVIAVAEDLSDPESLFAQEGDYSLVFMRRVVDGEVQTAILGESIVAELKQGETPFILTHSVAAIADLSGDGKMEIVIDEKYYEGEGWSVWEYVNDDLGPVFQVGAGCGV